MNPAQIPALGNVPQSSALRARGWGLRIVRTALLVYLGVLLVLFELQDHLIFPGSATQGQRDAMVAGSEGLQLLSLQSPDGVPIAAIFGKALQPDGAQVADASDRPTVVFLYGNGACMAYCTDIFQIIRKLGVNVIIPDFEGYGMSGGKPSEKGCYAAANAAYDYLLSRGDVNPKKIVAMGWSLGGAAAIDLASRRPVMGIVTISAFTNLADMARQIVRWFPTSFILKYRFDNVGKLAGIDCPILIVHGTEDDLVPFAMAPKLAAAAKGNVQRYNVQGAGHNDVFDVGGEELGKRVAQFISGLPTLPGLPTSVGR
jgi:hypothetical protein